MNLGQSHFYTFLFSTLLTLSISCRTTPVPPPPPNAEPARQIESTEPAGRETRAPVAESPVATPEPEETAPVSKQPPQTNLPESILSAPERERTPAAIKYDTVLAKRSSPTASHSGWQYRRNRQSQVVGFEFSNRGGNRILPQRHDIGKNLFYTRDFQFRFDDRARQDVHLLISDWVASRDKQFRLSELMNSIMLFFPRNYLPAVIGAGKRNIVTLPTGEEVEFDAMTHEVAGGVFSEAPVDLNFDRATRQFPGIDYTGNGVMVRANARGADPRVGGIAVVTTGSAQAHCPTRTGCNRCEVPAKEIWAQNGAVRFKFSRDEDFDRYLVSRCGFGLPAPTSLNK